MPKEYKIIVSGKPVKTSMPLPVVSPYDNSIVGRTYLAGEKELEEAMKGGVEAFRALKNLPSYKRAEIIGKVINGINERGPELARIIALEAGKPISDARAEVKRAITTFTIASEEAKRLDGSIIPLDIMEGSEKRFGIVKRFPVGPVLGISPFNFPLNLVAHKVAPAFACGCPIIIKPATKTPLSAIILGEIIMASGAPQGAISILPSKAEVAEKMVEDERIKKLTFTGSPSVGWRLKQKANTKKVTLELGGNAGVIVDQDAQIDYAVKRCITGGFSYAGQICISIQRIYVHKKIFDSFKKKFISGVKALKLGDPLDEKTQVGPLIDYGAVERTEDWVKEAVKQGAVILTGGKSLDKGKRFFAPTVLTNTKPEMKVSSEEAFSPLVVLEPFTDFEDAIKEINNSRYGLQAGVFTKDIKKAFYAYENLEVGGVIINDIPTYRVDNMPYGGVKMSGFGREGVRYAIEEMTEMKLMAVNLY